MFLKNFSRGSVLILAGIPAALACDGRRPEGEIAPIVDASAPVRDASLIEAGTVDAGGCGEEPCPRHSCAVDAASCAALTDECQVGICDPVKGCVAERQSPVGDDCGEVETLTFEPGQPQHREITGSTRCAVDRARAGSSRGCRSDGPGPDLRYAVDLTGYREPVSLYAVVDADFRAQLRLERGSCEDPSSIACVDPGEFEASPIGAQLLPGRYWIVVDSTEVGEVGAFRLKLAVFPTASYCDAPETNDACERRLPLPLHLASQTVLLDFPCNEGFDTTLYYEVDLSDVAAPATLSVVGGATGSVPTTPAIYAVDEAGGCGELLAEAGAIGTNGGRRGQRATLRASPGRYVVALERDDIEEMRGVSTARIEIDRTPCMPARGDRCDDPIEVDASENGLTLLEGNNFCNTNAYEISECLAADTDGSYGGSGELGADRFYRIDLSGREGRTRLRVQNNLSALTYTNLLYLLEEDESGACGTALYCSNTWSDLEDPAHLDLALEPGSYLLVVDADHPIYHGRYQLKVALEEIPDAWARPCIDDDIDQCLYEEFGAVGCDDPWQPGCLDLAVRCGLNPETRACICESDPVCCGAAGDASGCYELYRSCGLICPWNTHAEWDDYPDE